MYQVSLDRLIPGTYPYRMDAQTDATRATAAPIRNLGEPADAVPSEKCKWAIYITCHQAEASHQSLWLGALIAQNLKKRGQRLTRVWIDKQERATLDGVYEGVRLSRNYILFLTKQVLTREFCLNEIRNALKYRKNVIIVFQVDQRYGGVRGSFSEFYGPELKKAFPHPDDYMWLMRNSHVDFHDRGQHVDVMLCAILGEMELEEAPQVVLPHRLFWAARASGPNSHSMCALQPTLLCIAACTVCHGIRSSTESSSCRSPCVDLLLNRMPHGACDGPCAGKRTEEGGLINVRRAL